MTRDEAAAILARSLLDAGYTRAHGTRSPWVRPDGTPATRRALFGHWARTYKGSDRDPWLPWLAKAPELLWAAVDQAALTSPSTPLGTA